MSKNMTAGKGFTVKEKDGDVELKKAIWIDLIAAYEHYSNPDFVHVFLEK